MKRDLNQKLENADGNLVVVQFTEGNYDKSNEIAVILNQLPEKYESYIIPIKVKYFHVR